MCLQNDIENQGLISSKEKKRKKKIYKFIMIITFLVITVPYFTFINMYLVKRYNSCECTIPKKLVLGKVLHCDALSIKAQFTENGKNSTCIVNYDKPLVCNFPSVYIYVSKDTKHCSYKKDDDNCDNALTAFNVLSGIIALIIFGCILGTS